jgi:hypothetical protein
VVLGHRGKTWLSAATWLLLLITAFWPAATSAASPASSALTDWNLPVLAVAAQTPMEAQMLGERPTPPQSVRPQSYLQEISPGLNQGATLRLPKNFQISFRYNSDKPVGAAERLIQSHPSVLFKYSMDYCPLPNLKVGLSGFLYQPPADHLSLLRKQDGLVMGWGPSLKYDLGRWGFTFQSQVEKSRPQEDKDIQSWLRVWYAF